MGIFILANGLTVVTFTDIAYGNGFRIYKGQVKTGDYTFPVEHLYWEYDHKEKTLITSSEQRFNGLKPK